jgi:O-antigen/teichoic acid export membrane protein
VAAARLLPVAQFAVFSQLLVMLAFFVTLATGGVQHGLIREVAMARLDGASTAHSVIKAGLAIWIVVGAILVTAATLLAAQLSVLLVGSTDTAGAIPPMSLLAVGTGLGALLCAILTGQGRPVASLAAQGIGLIAATGLALLFLLRDQPVSAAIGFAAGPLLSTASALLFVGQPVFESIRAGRRLGASIRRLLGFSGAFLVTAALMPLTLLALRSVYLDAFGLGLLGYWLAANRISDVNTQLLGLYLTQEYLPRAAGTADPRSRRALLIQTFTIGTGAMMLALVIFSLSPALWISLFLSAKFVPAAGFVLGYLAGDVLRVAASLAGYTALAQGRLLLYISFEAAAAAGLIAFVLTLTLLRIPEGPAIAYPATYGLIAVGAAIYCWRAGFFMKGWRSATSPLDPRTSPAVREDR